MIEDARCSDVRMSMTHWSANRGSRKREHGRFCRTEGPKFVARILKDEGPREESELLVTVRKRASIAVIVRQRQLSRRFRATHPQVKQMKQQTMQGNDESPARPSPVACVPCRRRHLKCDALIPVCTRCQITSTECQYVRSRRGRPKHSRRASSQLQEEDISSVPADVFSDWLNDPDLDALATQDLLQSLDVQTSQGFPLLPGDSLVSIRESELVSPDVAHDPMVQLYYQNFHPSHPVMIPRKALNSPISHLIPSYLISVMRYIGAHYYSDPLLKQTFREPASSFLSDPTLRDGFKVQALLLLAIIDHSHCHEQSAHRLLQTAINLALELGLNHSRYAREHSYGHSVLEESWHRTYWELYIVDGLSAAMREQSPFRLYRQPANVELPCAEKMYSSDSVIQTGQTLKDLRNNWTLGQKASTFSCRIDAVRNLGAVLELNRSLESDLEARVEIIDANLASSLMALPPIHGDDGYDSSCHDEMIFQAQMTLYIARIYLHHPRSSMHFASFNTEPPTSCTRLRLTMRSEVIPPHNLDLHSHKLLRSADLLSGLAALPSAIRRRSPFFICALAMCIIVHTAALLVVPGSVKEESLRARIQLSMGGLKVLGKIWPLARTVRRRMVDMYREVLQSAELRRAA
ncbi:Zn(II)2Cys6 transcription factor [Aspergillus lucknowensis]|uniref:Zn(2)-C6 fungal-type domain-containing protein n=1 Tax=Aspergillus lucknowensis TaxID=176173 RepID=A0ABR4L958_9EURO